MTAPRPEAEAVEIVDAIFDEIDLHAHGAPPCEADCACCAEIRQDWIKRLDAALTAARADERERACKAVCVDCRNDVPIVEDSPEHHYFNDDGRVVWETCRAAAIRAMEGR